MARSRHYIWGAPLTRRGILEAVKDLSEHVPPNEQMAVLAGYLNRNTDKTLGVLTVATIILAVAAMFVERLDQRMVGAALTSCAIAVTLLLSNLWTHWRKDNLQFRRTPEGVEHILTLIASRVVRLSISTLLIMFSAVVIALAFIEYTFHVDLIQSLVDFAASIGSWGPFRFKT